MFCDLDGLQGAVHEAGEDWQVGRVCVVQVVLVEVEHMEAVQTE